MYTISLRKFRVQVPELTEPVTVVMRKGDQIVTLGFWTPGHPAFSVAGYTPAVDDGRPKPGDRPPVPVVPFSTRPFTPAPKPGRKMG